MRVVSPTAWRKLVDARVPGDFVAPTRAELAAVDALKRLFKP